MRARFHAAWCAVRQEVGADQPQQRGRRGVALILVLMVLAIMAAFTTEYHYKSYIRLHVASNLRDEVVAYYHARSAMEVARLVIKSQNVADNMLNAMAAFVPNIRNQNIELWTFACEFANAFCTGELKLMGKTFFNFEGMGGVGVEEGGACGCRAKPEDGAININRVDSIQDKNQLFSELYRELVRFREEPLTDVREIDEETAELVLNIIDWADPDTQRSDLVAGRLQDGIQGEGGNYALGVQAKDAKFDTLAELQLVEGMTRDLYCQISDKLTPYATRKLNVNTAQLSTLRAILCESAANQADTCYGTGAGQLPVMDYALYCMDMCRTLRQSLMSPGFGNIQSFLQFFSRLPWGPRPQFGNQLQQRIGVKSRVIRVETMGSSFGSNRGLTAVIDTSTGDYVYWREH